MKSVVTYLNDIGLTSYCEITQKEIRSMILSLIILYICSVTCKSKSTRKLNEELFGNYNVPSEITKIDILIKFIVNKQRKYAIECSSLELARNWKLFMKTFLFKD